MRPIIWDKNIPIDLTFQRRTASFSEKNDEKALYADVGYPEFLKFWVAFQHALVWCKLNENTFTCISIANEIFLENNEFFQCDQ